MTNVAGIILARMDSVRLPGKPLRPVLGRPLLSYVVGRARRIQAIDTLVLATTRRPVDDPLVEASARLGLDVFRGDTQDVARRFIDCASSFSAEFGLRLNADSPFLDPELITQGVARCRHTRPDLLTNLLPRTFPYGIAVEIIRIEALASALPRMNPQDREHLTRVFYSHPNDYRIESLRCPHPGLEAARLVVDTEADLAEFERLAREFGRRVETAPYHQVAARALAGLPSAEGS